MLNTNYFDCMNLINRLAFRYKDNALAIALVRPVYRMLYTRRKLDHKKRMFRQNAKLALERVKEALDFNGIPFWLEFGTLLGAYREHGFIKHDFDLDIGVFFKDMTAVYNALTNAGFKLIREFKVGDDGTDGFEQTYEYAKVTVDIFYFHRDESGAYCYGFAPFEDENRNISLFQVVKITVPYKGLTQIPFEGMMLNVPIETDKYLQAHYGADFMIPNEHFVSKKEATNFYYYPHSERVAHFQSWE